MLEALLSLASEQAAEGGVRFVKGVVDGATTNASMAAVTTFLSRQDLEVHEVIVAASGGTVPEQDYARVWLYDMIRYRTFVDHASLRARYKAGASLTLPSIQDVLRDLDQVAAEIGRRLGRRPSAEAVLVPRGRHRHRVAENFAGEIGLVIAGKGTVNGNPVTAGDGWRRATGTNLELGSSEDEPLAIITLALARLTVGQVASAAADRLVQEVRDSIAARESVSMASLHGDFSEADDQAFAHLKERLLAALDDLDYDALVRQAVAEAGCRREKWCFQDANGVLPWNDGTEVRFAPLVSWREADERITLASGPRRMTFPASYAAAVSAIVADPGWITVEALPLPDAEDRLDFVRRLARLGGVADIR